MIFAFITIMYILFKVYVLLFVAGLLTLYFVSPKFKDYIQKSYAWKEVLRFSQQLKQISTSIPISKKEKSFYYLGMLLVWSWMLNQVVTNYLGHSPLGMPEWSKLLEHQGFPLTGMALAQYSRHSYLKRKILFGQAQVRDFIGGQEIFRIGKTVFTYSNMGMAFSGLVTGATVFGVVNGVSDTVIARPPIQIGRALIGKISGAELGNSLLSPGKYNQEYQELLSSKSKVRTELIMESPSNYYQNRDPIPRLVELDQQFKKRWEEKYFRPTKEM